MTSFDFITDEAFRSRLESDYLELESCFQAKAWKSAHVAAGSVVEAVLIDYLIFSDVKSKGKGDPLKMDLATAINACQLEGAISEKTAHLCSAIKDYRNLIHPGRSIRLGETVDENTARVAQALVAIVVGEVSKKKKETYGYTAEQLIAKLEADPTAKSILRHLMEGMHDAELERLLLNAIPRRHSQLSESQEPPRELLMTLERCFDASFAAANEQTKQKTAKRLLSIVKSEGGDTVRWYEAAFFRAEQLKHLSDAESHLIKKHILGRAGQEETQSLFRLMRSLEEHITVDEANDFFAAMIYFAFFAKDEELKNEVEKYIGKPAAKMSGPCKTLGSQKMGTTIKLIRERGLESDAQKLEQIKKAWDGASRIEAFADSLGQLASAIQKYKTASN
jgi:hypothetical protein